MWPVPVHFRQQCNSLLHFHLLPCGYRLAIVWLRQVLALTPTRRAQPLSWSGSLPAWERYKLISKFVATSGSTVACMASTALIYAIDRSSPTLEVFMPMGLTSLAYLAVLLANEMLQDTLVWYLLAVRSPHLKAGDVQLLRIKAYPHLFESKESFRNFMLPLLCSNAFTATLISGCIDAYTYGLPLVEASNFALNGTVTAGARR